MKHPHTVHRDIYGRYSLETFWEGDEGFSGYFDEPDYEDDLEQRFYEEAAKHRRGLKHG